MKAILHIGHATAQTRQLRATLALNWRLLAQHDILFPAFGPKGQVWTLAQALPPQAGAETCPGTRPPADLIHGHEPLAHPGPAEFAALKVQISQISPATLLLCPGVVHPQEAETGAEARKALAALLAKGKTEVEIHASLPRPDLHLEQLLRQRIAAGAALGPLPQEALALLETAHVDYLSLLAPWRRLFPQAPLRILAEPAEEMPAASVDAFCRQLGLPDLSPAPSGTDAGETDPPLPMALLDLLRAANRLSPPEQRAHARQELLARYASLSLPPDPAVEILGPEVRKRLAERFAPVATELARLNGDTPVFTDLETLEALRPVPLAQLRPQLRAALPGLPFGIFQPHLFRLRRALA
jgi:hypothetical protein